MHRKCNFGGAKRCFSSEKRGRGERDASSRRGRPPCLPEKTNGSLREVVRQKGRAFAAVRADDLPQPLRRRVAIGSAPTEEGGKGFIHTKRSYAPV